MLDEVLRLAHRLRRDDWTSYPSMSFGRDALAKKRHVACNAQYSMKVTSSDACYKAAPAARLTPCGAKCYT